MSSNSIYRQPIYHRVFIEIFQGSLERLNEAFSTILDTSLAIDKVALLGPAVHSCNVQEFAQRISFVWLIPLTGTKELGMNR